MFGMEHPTDPAQYKQGSVENPQADPRDPRCPPTAWNWEIVKFAELHWGMKASKFRQADFGHPCTKPTTSCTPFCMGEKM